MKDHLAARMLSVGAVLPLLLLTALPSPILAAGEWIELEPDDGGAGDTVRVLGEGFNKSYRKSSGDWVYVYVRVYFSSDRADVGDKIDVEVKDYEVVDKSDKVDKNGEWKGSFTLPAELTDGEDDEDVDGGSYYVYVTYKGDDEIVAVGEFEVTDVDLYWYGPWHWSPFSSSWRRYQSPWYGWYQLHGERCCCPPCPCPWPWPEDWHDDIPCLPDDMPWPPLDWHYRPDCD